jgi:cation transport ATPase
MAQTARQVSAYDFAASTNAMRSFNSNTAPTNNNNYQPTAPLNLPDLPADQENYSDSNGSEERFLNREEGVQDFRRENAIAREESMRSREAFVKSGLAEARANRASSNEVTSQSESIVSEEEEDLERQSQAASASVDQMNAVIEKKTEKVAGAAVSSLIWSGIAANLTLAGVLWFIFISIPLSLATLGFTIFGTKKIFGVPAPRMGFVTKEEWSLNGAVFSTLGILSLIAAVIAGLIVLFIIQITPYIAGLSALCAFFKISDLCSIVPVSS